MREHPHRIDRAKANMEYLLVQAERQLETAKRSGNSALIGPIEEHVRQVKDELRHLSFFA